MNELGFPYCPPKLVECPPCSQKTTFKKYFDIKTFGLKQNEFAIPKIYFSFIRRILKTWKKMIIFCEKNCHFFVQNVIILPTKMTVLAPESQFFSALGGGDPPLVPHPPPNLLRAHRARRKRFFFNFFMQKPLSFFVNVMSKVQIF